MRQRLDTPLMRVGGDFVPVSWQEVFLTIKQKGAATRGGEKAAVAGEFASAEAIVCLKDLMNRLGSSNLHATSDGTGNLNADIRSQYLLNSTIAGLEDADVVLLVGTNPRMEAPLIAARLRKAVANFGMRVANVGPAADLAFPHTQLGNDSAILDQLAAGTHKWSSVLAKAERPMIIVGMSALRHPNSAGLSKALDALRAKYPNLVTEDFHGINILHSSAARVAAQDLGFVPGPNAADLGKAKFVYLLGADHPEALAEISPDAFVVYQGHHGDEGANRANVILPEPTYTEKSATYVNMEGRPQNTKAAVSKLQNTRDDWQILRALSEVLDVPLPYDSLDGVRARMVDIAPHLGRIGHVEPPSFTPAVPHFSGKAGKASPFDPLFDNFFLTNPIARSSKSMAKGSQQMPVARNSYIQ